MGTSPRQEGCHSASFKILGLVLEIQSQLQNYRPKKVRRKLIEKDNGKLRPLGIPCILDRIIQQGFKQVFEPIVEARFYKHSYGFRPLRSTHHAMARVQFLVNHAQLHYVVDIDVKGFFRQRESYPACQTTVEHRDSG
nr:reverse transcriptase domain-containing protein [Paenibacillus albidus]